MPFRRENALERGIDERRRARVKRGVAAQQLMSEALRHRQREKQAVEMTGGFDLNPAAPTIFNKPSWV